MCWIGICLIMHGQLGNYLNVFHTHLEPTTKVLYFQVVHNWIPLSSKWCTRQSRWCRPKYMYLLGACRACLGRAWASCICWSNYWLILRTVDLCVITKKKYTCVHRNCESGLAIICKHAAQYVVPERFLNMEGLCHPNIIIDPCFWNLSTARYSIHQKKR